MYPLRTRISTVAVVLLAVASAQASPRDVQLRSVNIQTGVIELHNFGLSAESLSGWQLCTFDDNEAFRYTGAAGLNGQSIDPSGSLFVHTFNDAPVNPSHINLSTLGGFFAQPIDAGPYALSMYSSGIGFIDPARLADHLMWNVGGVPGLNSGRANVAVSAGLWTATTDWITTDAASARIDLTDAGGGLLHGPGNYHVVTPLINPIVTPIPLSTVKVRLQTVADNLVAPNWGTSAPGQPGRLFVSDQPGTLWAIDLDTGVKSVFLDVSSSLVTLGVFGPGSFDERGLLGVAFHPDYATNGLLYTYTSQPVSGPADFSTMPGIEVADHQSVITEWHVPDPTNPASVANAGSARELLRIDEPQFNHNAGALNFGPDGKLYISLGDGGGADDEDGQEFFGSPIIGHGPTGNGSDPSNVLGTVLRIDPTAPAPSNGRYAIPGDNPFVGVSGFVDEIFAYGFRNPFRFSFDTATGDLYLGDVGQNDIEEIDIVTSGGNYGWNLKEGRCTFDSNGPGAGNGFVVSLDPGVPASLTDPIAEYDHDEGLSIVGGFVYHGTRVPQLAGRYIFGDFARTFSNDGRLFHLDVGNQVVELDLAEQPALGLSLLGFGQDAEGEVYVLANATGVPFGTGGVVLRISGRPGDINCDGFVNFADVAPFTQAILDPGSFAHCDINRADMDGDEDVDGDDIQQFVDAVLAGP